MNQEMSQKGPLYINNWYKSCLQVIGQGVNIFYHILKKRHIAQKSNFDDSTFLK